MASRGICKNVQIIFQKREHCGTPCRGLRPTSAPGTASSCIERNGNYPCAEACVMVFGAGPVRKHLTVSQTWMETTLRPGMSYHDI